MGEIERAHADMIDSDITQNFPSLYHCRRNRPSLSTAFRWAIDLRILIIIVQPIWYA